MPVAYILWDRQMRVLEWNRAAERLFGYTRSEVLGTDASDLINPESTKAEVDAVLRALQQAEPASFSRPESNLNKSGHRISCRWHNSIVLDADGEVNGFVSMVEDVTKQVEVEKVLREANRARAAINRIGAVASRSLQLDVVLQRILEGSLEATGASVGMIFIRNLETGLLTWGASLGLSDAFVSEYRRKAIGPGEGLTGQVAESGQPLYVPLDSSRDDRVARSVVEEEGLGTYIGVPIKAGDEVIAVMNLLSRPPQILEESSIALCEAIGLHVGSAIRNARLFTELQDAERALEFRARIAEVFLTAAEDDALGGVLRIVVEMLRSEYGCLGTVDAGGDLVASTLRGGERGDDSSTVVNRAYPRAEWSPWLQHVVDGERGEISTEPTQIPGIEGHSQSALAVAVAFRGKPIGVIVVADRFGGYGGDELDLLTSIARYIAPILHSRLARAVLAEQLRQSQKLEAVGRLAGGIAHDFNNLLVAIVGNSEMLLHGGRRGSSNSELVGQILDAANRAGALTSQLLAFSRKQLLQPQAIDLNETVSGVWQLVTRLIGEDIELSQKFGDAPVIVEADPGQIEQVIVNLAVNARDAMQQGGELTIVVGSETLAQGQLGLDAGDYAVVEISDTGSGMTPEVQARIFEPFFTTKAQGAGTGLGLSGAYGIIKQSRGEIVVNSEPGAGTTFLIYLPLSSGVYTPAATEPRPKEGPARHATILVAEDDEAARQVLVMSLRDLGYQVIAAKDGRQALSLSSEHQGDIQLLLTDIVMPRMGGLELGTKIRKTRRDIRVLYMSGYADPALSGTDLLTAGAEFLQKPFSPSQVDARIQRILGE